MFRLTKLSRLLRLAAVITAITALMAAGLPGAVSAQSGCPSGSSGGTSSTFPNYECPSSTELVGYGNYFGGPSGAAYEGIDSVSGSVQTGSSGALWTSEAQGSTEDNFGSVPYLAVTTSAYVTVNNTQHDGTPSSNYCYNCSSTSASASAQYFTTGTDVFDWWGGSTSHTFQLCSTCTQFGDSNNLYYQ